jgi:pyridinium-3,5-biscarboxylic acid mononucleotide synthase
MDDHTLRKLLGSVQRGTLEVEEALSQLRNLPYEQVGDFARVDHHRNLRCGFPEVIFGSGKSPEQIIGILHSMMNKSGHALVTRVETQVYETVRAEFPEAVYHAQARSITLGQMQERDLQPGVLVITAGTADIPVAEEAALTAEMTGSQVERLYDVGVAGLHRLLDKAQLLQQANVIVVAAGMEGALASVVGGLVSAPVIAVPTSVGYGASFNGLAALLAMLNTCAPGVAVVNIDNGFGAGYMAGMINRTAAKRQPSEHERECDGETS